MAENKMFCFQCQETAGCKGCTVSGVCGKKPEVVYVKPHVLRGVQKTLCV